MASLSSIAAQQAVAHAAKSDDAPDEHGLLLQQLTTATRVRVDTGHGKILAFHGTTGKWIARCLPASGAKLEPLVPFSLAKEALRLQRQATSAASGSSPAVAGLLVPQGCTPAQVARALEEAAAAAGSEEPSAAAASFVLLCCASPNESGGSSLTEPPEWRAAAAAAAADPDAAPHAPALWLRHSDWKALQMRCTQHDVVPTRCTVQDPNAGHGAG